MSNDNACDRCRALLPEYAAGAAVTVASRAAVEQHLATCAACARDLAEWHMLAGVVRAASPAAMPQIAFDASWSQLAARITPLPEASAVAAPVDVAGQPDAADAVRRRRALATPALMLLVAASRHAVRVLGGQVRLLRRAMWSASALGVALAVLYAFTLPRGIGETDVLAFALPLIAATGIAFLYGPEVDAGLELALATPTSPRLVLLSRFALLFGYDAVLALTGTLALSLARHDGFWSLASAWVGPTLLLSTLSLALSLALGPAVAVSGAAALWISRVLRLDGGFSLHIGAGTFWPTSPQIIALSLALLIVAVLYVPRQQRLRPDADT